MMEPDSADSNKQSDIPNRNNSDVSTKSNVLDIGSTSTITLVNDEARTDVADINHELSAKATTERPSFFLKHGLPHPAKLSVIRDRIRQKHHRARYVSPVREKGNHKNVLKNFLIELFITREMAPKGDRERYVKYSVRQFFIFIYFMLCLTVVGYSSQTNIGGYHLQTSMTDIFIDEKINQISTEIKTFKTIATVEDFWNYLEHGLLNNMYWEHYYNAGDAEQHHVQKVPDSINMGIFYVNQLVGAPRLRQLRISSDSCHLAEDFRHLTRICFPEYTEAFEERGDKNHFWPVPRDMTIGKEMGYPREFKEAWHYRTATELRTSSHWGDLHTYSGSGAVQNLVHTKNESRQIVQTLKKYLWVDKSTRAVFLDFTVYNSNIDMFCIVRLLFEFPATGGVTTSHLIHPLRIIHYEEWYEAYVVAPCEIFIAILTIYYLIQEIMEMIGNGLHDYVRDLWSWLDLVIIVTAWIAQGAKAYFVHLVQSTLKDLNKYEIKTNFYIFEEIVFWNILNHEAICIVLFLCWCKSFQYMPFSKTMAQLCATLNRCSQDIAGFAVLFFIVFISFAQLAYLQFGAQVKDFRTFEDSIFTLLRMILGDFDFHGLEEASPIIGPIFFVVYIFFIFFVLLNMFLAIMNDTYSEVKAEIQGQRNEFEIADYLIRGVNNFLDLFGCRSTQLDAENAVKLAAADGQLTYDEITRNLRKADFTELEIEVFLDRHQLTGGHSCLDEEEAQQRLDYLLDKVCNDMDKKVARSESNYDPSHFSIKFPAKSTGIIDSEEYSVKDKFLEFENRVTTLEASLSRLIMKINDTVGIL